MTMGLPCDGDGYDLRIEPCSICLSRGCPQKHKCREDTKATDKAWRADYLRGAAERKRDMARRIIKEADGFQAIADRLDPPANA